MAQSTKSTLVDLERYKNMVLIHKKISDSVTRTAPSSNKRPDKNTQYHKKDARENQ